MAQERVSHPVDVHVGEQIRIGRWTKDMTQQQLAEKVGVRFQQMQKYETGKNRVSASRLWDIAQVLQAPVSFFFEGLQAAGQNSTVTVVGPSVDVLKHKETIELLRNYYAISENKRRRLLDLAKALSKGK